MNEHELLLSELAQPPKWETRVVILPDAIFDALLAQHPTLEQVRGVWPSHAHLPDRIVAHPSGRVMDGA